VGYRAVRSRAQREALATPIHEKGGRESSLATGADNRAVSARTTALPGAARAGAGAKAVEAASRVLGGSSDLYRR